MRHPLAIAIALEVGAVLVLARACVPTARAQAGDAVVDLARICVSEAGWSRTNDCAAIASVLRWRAKRRGVHLASMMRSYSTSVFDRARRDHRRWVAWLDPAVAPPRGWPSDVSWTRVGRPGWERRLREARALLETPRRVCREQPEHWGARSLDRSAEGWERVDCGRTLNIFWRVP